MAETASAGAAAPPAAPPSAAGDDTVQTDSATVPDRVDPTTLKDILNDMLKERAAEYWESVNRFIKLQMGKLELDAVVQSLLGPHRLKYHNAYIATLLSNATFAPLVKRPAPPAPTPELTPESPKVKRGKAASQGASVPAASATSAAPAQATGSQEKAPEKTDRETAAPTTRRAGSQRAAAMAAAERTRSVMGGDT